MYIITPKPNALAFGVVIFTIIPFIGAQDTLQKTTADISATSVAPTTASSLPPTETIFAADSSILLTSSDYVETTQEALSLLSALTSSALTPAEEDSSVNGTPITSQPSFAQPTTTTSILSSLPSTSSSQPLNLVKAGSITNSSGIGISTPDTTVRSVTVKPLGVPPNLSSFSKPPYPALPAGWEKNVTLQNVLGTRPYGWEGCSDSDKRQIKGAYDEFQSLVHPFAWSGSIDWTDQAAKDFWGPSRGKHEVLQENKDWIESMFTPFEHLRVALVLKLSRNIYRFGSSLTQYPLALLLDSCTSLQCWVLHEGCHAYTFIGKMSTT
jgi:hypothetical protein